MAAPQTTSSQASNVAPFRHTFLNACIASEALKFGDFTLKSGRHSPYFFNAGLFHRADLINSISTALAETIIVHGSGESETGADTSSSSAPLDFDILFGPAYKGIPLAAVTTAKLGELAPQRFGQVSYSFNRKEAKSHGEGGTIVGASLAGRRVVIVDDVITAGTAIREAVQLIRAQGGVLVGIVVAFDRLERSPRLGADGLRDSKLDDCPQPGVSAVDRVRMDLKVPVLPVLTLDHVLRFLRGVGSREDVARLEEYRAMYGVDAESGT